MLRSLARRLAPAALFALSLAACLAAACHVSAPPSHAQPRTPARFAFGPSPYRVSEGDGGVDVTVVRSGDTGRAASVEYQASNGYLMAKGCGYLAWVGTATPGEDYEAARGTLAFAAGETTKTFRVVVKDDTLIESRNPETVFLSLDFSHEAPAGSDDCFGSVSLINIHDNDPPPAPQPPPSGRRQIAFGSNRDGNYEIYSMDEDGANVRRLTDNLANDAGPAWSPDGKRIAFTSDRDGRPVGLYVMNADGSGVTRLADVADTAMEPAWSPDGTRIAYTGFANDRSMEIFAVNADGTNRVNLSNNRGEDFGPRWSPDGRRLAFTSRRDNGTFSVYVMDSDGANVRRLVEGYSRDPAWSPDGGKVAYAAQAPQNSGTTSIFVVNADGTNKRLLSGEHPFVYDVTPAWSPDGAKIAFASNRSGNPSNYEIHVMNADGTNVTRVTDNPAHEAQPAWQPSAATATPAAPVLLTESGSARAVALDSVTFVLDPFAVVSPANLFSADRRTRVALFAAGVAHPATAADISVQAEDPTGRTLQLPVEYVGRVSGFDWLTQIVVRLPDEASTAEHLWLGLNVRGTPSNKAVVTMKTKQ